MSLRILHISDLHERAKFRRMPSGRQAQIETDAEQRGYVLGERFLQAIRDVGAGNVDLVCLTGDVADWARPEEYAKASKRVEAILKATGVARERLFVVPGNHDVRRDRNDDARRAIQGWMDRGGDVRALGEWLRRGASPPPGVEPAWRKGVFRRTEGFWAWLATMGRGDLRPDREQGLGYRFTIAAGTIEGVAVPLHVIGLDSAWLCGEDREQGQILLTEAQVRHHIRNGEQALDGFRLALVHHPLDHLRDHNEVRRLLADDGVDLLLHGHQHTPVALTVDEAGTSLRELAAGCLMEGELGQSWPNEFHLVEVDLQARRWSCTVHLREWSPRAHDWAPGTGLYRNAKDGVLHWGSPKEALTIERVRDVSGHMEDLDSALELLDSRLPEDERYDSGELAALIRRHLSGDFGASRPAECWTAYLLLAKQAEEVVGMLLGFTDSQAKLGFISFLVSKKPEAGTVCVRKREVSKRLLEELLRELKQRGQLPGMLTEVDHPARTDDPKERQKRLARIKLFEHVAEVAGLSLRCLDLPYLQPKLDPQMLDSPEPEKELVLLCAAESLPVDLPKADAVALLTWTYTRLYSEDIYERPEERARYARYGRELVAKSTARLPDQVRLLRARQLFGCK